MLRMFLMHGEKESLSANDFPRTTAGKLQKIVESRAQKTFKNMVKQHLHHHMLFGRVQEKWSSSSKNKLQHIQLSDMTGTANETGFYGQMKLKNYEENVELLN